jgi:CHAT domain-containing protein
MEARNIEHESTLRAYSACLGLLNRLLVQRPTLESQHEALLSQREIPKHFVSEAASAAIEYGSLETAIEMLEQGRAVLWSKMRGYRHPLNKLRETHPDLFDLFGGLSSQLERLAMTSKSEGSQEASRPLDSEIQERTYRTLSQRWEETVEQIRQLEGFQDFLQAVPYSTLKKAAAEGPVIVINISDYRSDAIIVFHSSDPVLVPLPGATPRKLAKLVSRFSDPRSLSFQGFSDRLLPVLRSLWKKVVGPVVEQLKSSNVKLKSRIWWCPTAELCALPIHAAGLYLPKEKSVSDLYISSYISTLSALITARSGMASKPTFPKLLVVGDHGGESIPRVKEEVERVKDFGDFVDVLTETQANCENVIAELQTHSWAHFACHGHRDIHPFHSSFQLHNDERLEILHLIKAHLPDAELAFVSACHGAAVDIEGTPDEVIHLSAALQFSGFRSVVGTLWSMADLDGPDVAEDFYRHMFRDLDNVDFRDAAAALNVATKAMRRREGMTLGRWVNFVHIGA